MAVEALSGIGRARVTVETFRRNGEPYDIWRFDSEDPNDLAVVEGVLEHIAGIHEQEGQ